MVQSITRVLLFSCLYPAIAGFWVSASAGQRYLSPCSVVAGKTGDTLYIAEFDAQQIAVYDVTGCKVSSVISLAGGPVDLAACPDRSRLYVTLGGSAGKVCEIDLNTQEVVGCAGVGHTPGGVVISPDCKSLYVCNQFDNNVSVDRKSVV